MSGAENTTTTADTTTTAATTTSAANTTAAAETTTTSAEPTTSANDSDNVSDTVANVLRNLGEDYEVLYTEELPHNPGDDVLYIVTVRKDGTDHEYIANGHFFMKRDEYTESVINTDDNPLKDYAGDYTCDRVRIEVVPFGSDSAEFKVHWGSSAEESYEWRMTGTVTETYSTYYVAYNNGILKDVVYESDGSAVTSTELQADLTGSFTIDKESHKLFWNDDAEERSREMVFTCIEDEE